MAKRKTPQLFHNNPEALIAVSFFAAIAAGALLLKLPFAAVSGRALSAVDALFMATSATCVTGLSVVDIGSRLSLFGQLVLLGLVQIGGLGIMTFSLLFFMLLGRRVSLCGRYCMDTLSDELDLDNFRFALAKIFTVTAGVELCGAVLLFAYLRHIHTLPGAVYSSIFHTVAAFCNAGFSLYHDNLGAFVQHPYVQCVIMGLIIIGGLGFIVIDELMAWVACRPGQVRSRLSLHSRVALTGTGLLIAGGTLGIWLLEKNNVLSGLAPPDQIANAAFLSITSRTAGFNTLSTGLLTNASLCVVIFLMFIGACSGSTAGGIKIGTFFTLLSVMIARLKGQRSASLFHRRLPEETVDKAMIVFVVALLIIFIMVFALQMTEAAALSRGQERGMFLNLLFEAVSAFGTVGLSTGVTPELSALGKMIIVLLMFVGRVGPLTLVVALQVRKSRTLKYEYPQGDILIG